MLRLGSNSALRLSATGQRCCCVQVHSRVSYRFSTLIATFLAAWLLFYATYATASPPGPIAYRAVVSAPGIAPVGLHVEEIGNGPPLLLIHGLGGSAYSFRYVIGSLARDRRVITIDLKGFGASDKPFDLTYSASDQARLVLAFIAQRGYRKIDVAGHSFGGTVALIAAAMEQRSTSNRIGKLVLLSAPAYPQHMRRGLEFLTLPVLPYIALAVVPPILTARSALETWYPSTPRSGEADAISYAEPLYDAAGRHALIATTRAIATFKASGKMPDYSGVQKPTLLIWCRQDPTVPLETGERLARELPRAKLAILEQCEHGPAEEQPGATVQLLRRFLAGS